MYKRQDYNKVLEYHISKKADVTVVCKDMPANVNVERFGTIKMNEESRIEEFEEKPIEARSNTISCGIYAVSYTHLDVYKRQGQLSVQGIRSPLTG